MIPSVDATGLLTLTSTTYWRPGADGFPEAGIDEGGNPHVTGSGFSAPMNDVGSDPNFPEFAARTIDHSDSRFTKIRQQHALQLPAPGLYTISADSCCRVSGIINANGSSWQMDSSIYWDGQTASTPINFSLNAVQTEVVRGADYSKPLSAVPASGLTLSYDQVLNLNITSQPPGFTVNPITGLLSIPAANTINYLDNPTANEGADYAFSGNIFARDASGTLIGQVEFDNMFDAVGAPGHTPVADDASIDGFVNQTITHTFTGSDPDNDPLTWTFIDLVGPGNAEPEIAHTFNPLTQEFSWNTAGSIPGTWIAQVQASDGSRTDIGDLTINLETHTSGVTVLVHGFTPWDPIGNPFIPFNPIDDYWDRDNDRIKALLIRVGGGVVYVYQPAEGDFQIDGRDEFFDNFNADGEIVLVYDWGKASNDPEGGQAEAAADALFASLISAGYADPTNPAQSSHFHFIGHSRGCSVVSETVQRLGTYGITVDYVTYLDNHDFGQPGEPSRTGRRERGGGIPFDEEFHDPAVQVWSNVLYADNYWQQLRWDFCRFNPAGRPLEHILNWPAGEDRDISTLVDPSPDGCPRPHGRVIDYYWGTVTPDTEDSDWYPDGTGATSGYSRWFNSGGYGRTTPDPSITSAIDPYSTNVIEFWWGTEGRYKFDNGVDDPNGVPPSVFMGDFDLPDLENTIAGWTYHGGEGSGRLKKVANKNYCLRLMQHREFRQHNRMYFPAGTTQIAFGLRVSEISADDVLRLSIGDADVAYQISLTATTPNFVPQTIPISQYLTKSVSTFKFEIIDLSGDGIQAVVDIDNIMLGTGADVNAHNEFGAGADMEAHNPDNGIGVFGCGAGMCGIGAAGFTPFFLLGLGWMRRTRKQSLRRRC